MIIIAAMTRDRVIGKDGKLPWRIPDDMDLFRQFTVGNTVIMGRKTYESIGRPLKDRVNIVVSSSMHGASGLYVCRSLEKALDLAGKLDLSNGVKTEAFVIGGSGLYQAALPLAGRMYISYVKQDYRGDAYFPEFSEEDWVVKERKEYNEFRWVHYERGRHA